MGRTSEHFKQFRIEPERRKKPEEPNAQLIEDVSHADKLGISYGVYKASEAVWIRKYKLRIMEEQRR